MKCVAFLPDCTICQLKKAAWCDVSSTIKSKVAAIEARVDELVIPTTSNAHSKAKAHEQAEEHNPFARHVYNCVLWILQCGFFLAQLNAFVCLFTICSGAGLLVVA
jgi:hypothetical protein